MPSFDALQVVEPLKFSFGPYLDLHGTIPEPSEAQLGKFYSDVVAASAQTAKTMKGIDGVTDPEKLMAALAKLPDGALGQNLARLNKPYADLCSGFPSEEQIGKLPPRVRLAFFAWLSGELNPEASGAGSKTAPATGS